MTPELKEYLNTFFRYRPEGNGNLRKLNRPFKWQNVKKDLDLINSLNPTLVLDIGCGDNRYKSLVNNLIGIDIVYKPLVDIVGDFTNLDFEDNSVDAIIAYGSINFGDEELIVKQLQEVYRVLRKDGIICFRGYHGERQFTYNWTEKKCYKFTKQFNFKLLEKPQIIFRLNNKGELNEKWEDRRFQRNQNNPTVSRPLTRLWWIWQK